MWKILNLCVLLSTHYLRTANAGSYIDNVIEEQHRVINEMNQNFTDLEKVSEKLINLGTFVGSHKVPPKTVKITKTVAVKVPVPYPVKIPHPVPVPIPVSKPVPVPVPKIIKVPEASPLPTAPSYATTPETIPTAVALTSRSLEPSGNSYLLSGEQETAHSNNHEQIQEFVRSYPVHSVYDAGVDYNPYMGNRLAKSKQVASASEDQPTKYRGSDLEQLQEYREPSQKYSNDKHSYAGYRSTAQPQATASPSHAYHEYTYSTGHPQPSPSPSQDFHPEVIPNSYRTPTKSTYFSKEYEKYPTPKFPRPTSSAYPTSPTYSTQDVSYGEEEQQYEGHNYKIQHHRPTPTAAAVQSVRDSYPRYEKPNLQHYEYQKPTGESYRHHYEKETVSASHPQKSLKYVEHYQRPTAVSYSPKYHEEEHQEHQAEPSAHYKQHEEHGETYLAHDETYSEHKTPSEQYESQDLYAKPSATPEAYSQYEHKEPQYTPQEYKTYYAKPTPVSEALTYLEENEPSHNTEHVVHVKPQSYRYKSQKDHKLQYPSKSNTIPYNFPSDSHLHPSYSESAPATKHKPTHYYSSNPDHSFDEESRPEPKYYHHPHQDSPSPSPSSHITSYDHALVSGNEYHHHRQYARPSAPSHHHDETSAHADGSDIESAPSKDHEAYERAVEQSHRAAHPNEYAEYSHEHLHHHHPAAGREDGGRDY
ncbi:cell surface glycoprotein 1-like [Armigeres subalbatus]|uniref:cell surface glycoprotein 1-like n=1 Tax=Armigeres subalbatus TaxID=124917 RepID=UPI002ED346F9